MKDTWSKSRDILFISQSDAHNYRSIVETLEAFTSFMKFAEYYNESDESNKTMINLLEDIISGKDLKTVLKRLEQ